MNSNSLSKINKYLYLVITLSMALLFVACSGDVKRLGESDRFLYKNVTNTPSSYKGRNSYNENKIELSNDVLSDKLLPEKITIIVQRGEDIYSISRQYDTSVDNIVSQNLISYPYKLRVGQKIIITTNADNLDTSIRNIEESSVQRDDYYIVKSGDNLSLIANKYNIDVNSLTLFNNINDPGMIYIGQELAIPKTDQMYNLSQKKSTPINLEEEFQEKNIIGNDVSKVQKINFRWPVKGRVVHGFSDLVNGEVNQGINISVPVGTSIKAAEEGIVLFSGAEDGLGNVVLIKHNNGWITSYRHLSEYLVLREAVVSRGQVIGKSGKSNDLDTPQLHFGIKKDSVNMNPKDYLPK